MRRTLVNFQTVLLTFLSLITVVRAADDCPPPVKQTATLATSSTPYQATAHNIGNWVYAVDNWGMLGGTVYEDLFTGERIDVASEFPKYSLLHNQSRAAFWVGGILDGDTLVSTGWLTDMYGATGSEWRPVFGPTGELTGLSVTDPDSPEYDNAVSEQDFVTTYTDTAGLDEDYYHDYFRGYDHRPLNIEIEQSSFAWSGALAEDLILFNVKVRNIGDETIEQAFFGIYAQPMVGFTPDYG